MKWINRLKSKAALDRIAEEMLYEAAYKEVDSGQRRAGLWAKALAKANGSEETAKSLYIEFLVQKYKDESHLQEEIMREAFEKGARQQRQAQAEAAGQRRAPEQEHSSQNSTKSQQDKEMWEPAVSGDTVFWVVIAFIGALIFLAIAFSL